MKKMMSALLIVICLVMAIPAQAQLKFGVKGGLNLAKADFNKSDLKTDNFTGFFIGPMAELTIPVVGLGVDGALLFSQRGIKVYGESEKENGLEIPVNLKYTIGLGSLLGIYVAAGPDFYFDFDKNKSIYGGDLKGKNTQVGINLGAGVKLIKHLQLGFNYNIPLGDSFSWENSEKALSTKNKVWQISAAYIF